ncbi:hypothetical protein WA026_022919 [Henosepilachna vigintioctopunctata]|uniref:Peptidase S1 domain-containing protein n=1 Tax=Henosepilachna vigintioctopunctata TaxID=420089 RepID=A0AAW1TPR1_9CUCU
MTSKILIVLIVLAHILKALIQKENYDYYSFMALIFSVVNGTVGEPCSGYIYTQRMIVTTANCYVNGSTRSFVLLVGLNRSHSLVNIQKWILHPYYSPATDKFHNEIAIVRTETNIDFNRLGTMELVPEDILVHDMYCMLVGWKIDEIDFIGKDFFTLEVQTIGKSLTDIYTLQKTIISPIQCYAQLNIAEKNLINLDDSFLCVKPDPSFNEDHNYGTLGSLLLCRERLDVYTVYLVGLKRKQREIERKSPELFINIRKYSKYLTRILLDHNSEPIIYFCEIRVCGKKYYTYGEYCILGDQIGCLHINRKIEHYFPQSNANQKLFSCTLSLFTLFISILVNSQ